MSMSTLYKKNIFCQKNVCACVWMCVCVFIKIAVGPFV